MSFQDPPERAAPDPPRRARLFRVLVLGGALLAAAAASRLGGAVGTPSTDAPDGGDGGVPGW